MAAPEGGGRHQALRRPGRRQRAGLRAGAGRDRQRHRAQRRRQDDVLQLHRRLLPHRRGAASPSTAPRSTSSGRTRSPTWASRGPTRTSASSRRMTALENILVGEHQHLRATWLGAVIRTRGSAARRRVPSRRPGGCSTSWACEARATCWRPSSRTATSAASRSPGRWPTSPGCCSSTSRRPGMNPAETQPDDRVHPAPARRARHHHPAHRARDAGRDGHLGADHRPRLRPEDRRGHAARDPGQPAGDRGLPRAGRPSRRECGPAGDPRGSATRRGLPDGHAAPRGRGRPHLLRQHPRPPGDLAPRRRGRDRDADRRQRGRQDHDPQHDQRARPCRGAATSASRARTWLATRPTRSRPRGSSRSPRVAASSPA